MPVHPNGFSCKQCGACCRAYVQVTESDLLRWAAGFREDVLAWVSPEEGLIHPLEESEGARCPFLERLTGAGDLRERYVCRIHDTRPDACRRFPASREQAARVGCIGLE
jgi:Fe-S-cluster containining protein